CFSSPWARATCLPIPFCSARSPSYSAIAERRATSAASSSSTSAGSSPREVSEARTMSGSLRNSFGSITARAYRARWLPGTGYLVDHGTPAPDPTRTADHHRPGDRLRGVDRAGAAHARRPWPGRAAVGPTGRSVVVDRPGAGHHRDGDDAGPGAGGAAG